MSNDFTNDTLNEIFTSVITRSRNEIIALTQAELDTRWYFKYDVTKSTTHNLYEFISCLELYKRTCRQWEEAHNGNCCVVERVRDTYLMPKIKEFLNIIKNIGLQPTSADEANAMVEIGLTYLKEHKE